MTIGKHTCKLPNLEKKRWGELWTCQDCRLLWCVEIDGQGDLYWHEFEDFEAVPICC
jgi:hypothetical protein